jgi:hypothetical protein
MEDCARRPRYPSSRTFFSWTRRRRRHPAKVAEMLDPLSCKRRGESVPGPQANMLRNKERVPRVQARKVWALPTHYSRQTRPRRALPYYSIRVIIFRPWNVSPTHQSKGKYAQSVKSSCVARVKDRVPDVFCSSLSRRPKTQAIACSTPSARHLWR